MKDKTPAQIVDETLEALRNSQPCPYCRMYDGTHVLGCQYLLHKGNVDAARLSNETSKSSVGERPGEQEEGEEEASKENIDAGTAELLEQMKPRKK